MVWGKNCFLHFQDEENEALREWVPNLLMIMCPTSGTASIQTQAVELQSLYSTSLNPEEDAR